MTELKPGTPLPWRLSAGNEIEIMGVALAQCGGLTGNRLATAEANAAYIVHACNEYPALLALVGELVGALEVLTDGDVDVSNTAVIIGDRASAKLREARAALTRAKETIDG